MLKKEIRSQYRKRRNGISLATLENASLGITQQVLRIPLWNFEFFHIFLPIPDKREVDTAVLVSLLQSKHKKIVLPKVTGPGTMEHYQYEPTTQLVISPWGIPEPSGGIRVPPEKIDVVFVPLLAFDQNGHRVGYGKGFYDRFLAQCRPDTKKVGLSVFDVEEEAISDPGADDIRLDYAVTPKTVYTFSMGEVD